MVIRPLQAQYGIVAVVCQLATVAAVIVTSCMQCMACHAVVHPLYRTVVTIVYAEVDIYINHDHDDRHMRHAYAPHMWPPHAIAVRLQGAF